MEELTESARQYLVSQGIVMGVLSAFNSFGLFLIGIIVITRAKDILHFTALSHLAFLQIGCGVSTFLVVAYIWWIVAAYRNRQIEIRAKYLDENITRALAALIIPLIVTFSAVVVSAIFLRIKSETSSVYDLKSAMALYSSDVTRKVIVDKLQIIFECCGSQSLIDWFLIDWQNPDLEPLQGFGNLTFVDWDSVPFSCCCPESPPPCIHHQLKTYGIGSIFSEGCSEKLDNAILTYLMICLVMFMVSTILMVMLIYTSRKLQTSARSAVLKGDSTAPGVWWIISPATSKITQMYDRVPLLDKTRNVGFKTCESTSDFWAQPTQIVVTPTIVSQKSKIIDSTIHGDWDTRSKNADGYDSEDWTRMACEASGYTSSTSFLSESRPMQTSTESRHSRSDTAVAHLEVSRHHEHKVRPLFRT